MPCGAAVADLPAGQRKAVEMFYYADLPAGRLGESPGAAKASLPKARRRLGDYITAHRPDLIPAVSRRMHMTAVRIAHAELRPGGRPNGDFNFKQVVVVLADDPCGRALQIWLTGRGADSLWRLLDRPRGGAELSALSQELTSEALTDPVLRAAGVTVTGVDIDELGPEVTAARIEFIGLGRTQHLTVSSASNCRCVNPSVGDSGGTVGRRTCSAGECSSRLSMTQVR